MEVEKEKQKSTASRILQVALTYLGMIGTVSVGAGRMCRVRDDLTDRGRAPDPTL